MLLLAVELDSLSASATAAAVLLSLGRVLQNAFLQPLPMVLERERDRSEEVGIGLISSFFVNDEELKKKDRW